LKIFIAQFPENSDNEWKTKSENARNKVIC